MKRHLAAALCTPFLFAICAFASGDNYKNFDVASYATVRDGHSSGSRTSGDPVLLKTKYSKGLLYVLTIPNAQGDLLCFLQPVLSEIRNVLAKDMFVRLDTLS